MTIMRRAFAFIITTCLAATLVLQLPAADAVNQPETPCRVLLITGEDYPGHKWRETAPALLAELNKDPRIKIDMLADLSALKTTRLSDYNAVVVHFKNYDPQVPGRKGFDNLAKYVEQGGGLMLLHFACGAFEEFKKEFEPVAGRVWFGMTPPTGRHQHDPRGSFTVNINKTAHPITTGMKDFETVDELYTCLEGDTPITPLATAVSKVDGKTYPMAFVLQSGKGRVFHCVLGHDVEAFSAPGPAQLMQRGCAWVAGLEPTVAK